MKTFVVRPLASLIAAFSLTLVAVPARAGDDVDFAYSAHELDNSTSVTKLYARMTDEALNACDVYQNSGLFGVAYREACAAALMDDLIAGVGDSGLTALHDERQGARFAGERLRTNG